MIKPPLSCLRFCAAVAMLMLVVMVAPGMAQAGSLGVADGYNVFVFTTLQSSSDIGGRAAAGTYIDGTVAIGNDLTSSPANYDVVAGSGVGSGSRVMVNSKGSAYLPNGVSGSNVNMNGGGSVVTTGNDPINFATAQSQYTSLSTQLAGLATTGTYSSGKIVATNTGINVFDLTVSQYLALSNISTDGGTVIIKVAGTPSTSETMFVDGQENTGDATGASKVLFNFYQDAGTLTLGNSFGGSVLAPWATVSGSSEFNGSIIANALNFTGEIHPGSEFDGQLPTATPEPAAPGLAGIGFAGLALFLRRRKT